MGIAERKERQKAELREQILSAARAIVLEHGYEALSMRKIADAIEYSAATIYLHFAGRDEIALELVRDGFIALLAALEPAQSIADPLERLRQIGREYIRFGLEHPETYRLIFMQDPKFSDTAIGAQLDAPHEPGSKGFDVLMSTARELVETGTFRAIDPQIAAQITWASVHGLVSLQLVCPNTQRYFGNVDVLADSTLEVVIRGLLAEDVAA